MPSPHFPSRLPDVGTTIFSTMSALAARHGAVNLGQGFPDFDCDPLLVQAVTRAMQAGHNQYPPMPGVPALRQAVAAMIATQYGRDCNPDTDITITAGATQALLSAILAVTQPGDEVIVLDPCYDSYVPAIRMAGAVPVRVPLAMSGPPRERAENTPPPAAAPEGQNSTPLPPAMASVTGGATGNTTDNAAGSGRNGLRTPPASAFIPDFARIAAAITPRTRLLVINTPHNPSGSVWSDAQMQQLQALLAPTNILLLSDEVYEHMVFDGQPHQSVLRYPALAERAFVVSSFGKTFHVTGWKVGTVVAPEALMREFRKIHQFSVFAVNTPAQHGLAHYLAWLQAHPEHPGHYRNLPDFYQRKRNLFRAGLAGTGFRLLDCAGTYFQTVDVTDMLADHNGTLSEAAFCEWLTAHAGVAAIPLSPFYGDGRNQNLIRFCFAKKDETLHAALDRLRSIRDVPV